jgi:hypothetical protein
LQILQNSAAWAPIAPRSHGIINRWHEAAPKRFLAQPCEASKLAPTISQQRYTKVQEGQVATYLGAVTLRNERHIYEEGNAYYVEETDKHGRVYKEAIPGQAVAFLRETLGGTTATVEDALEALEPVAGTLGLPYTYGHKLKFYAQNVLLVLVAKGEADVEQQGRAYHYTIW